LRPEVKIKADEKTFTLKQRMHSQFSHLSYGKDTLTQIY